MRLGPKDSSLRKFLPLLPMKLSLWASILSLFLSSLSPAAADTSSPWVYFGTYTNEKTGSEGIYVSRFDTEKGTLSEPRLVAEMINPTFLAIPPNGRFLYAVSEVARTADIPGGTVSAFAINPDTGDLTLLNEQMSGGAGPCHISVDPSGRCVLVANYGGGSCAALPLAENGTLLPAGDVIEHEGSSVNPKRQKAPHAHSANPSPDGKYAFVADLGTDRIEIYALDARQGGLDPHHSKEVAPGSGPRHFTFHPSGKFAWVINELTRMITGYRYDPEEGLLTEIETLSTIPAAERDQPGQSTAEIQVHPNGRFLYGSNRGHDTIAVFQIDEADGTLNFLEVEPIQGKTPRNFGIDPTGQFLLAAGQNSHNVRVFRIDPESGALEDTGHEINVGAPVCVRFVSPPQ